MMDHPAIVILIVTVFALAILGLGQCWISHIARAEDELQDQD